jgi:DnaJ-domain-containing protein 1
MQGNREAVPAIEPNRPKQSWQFINDFQQMAGDNSEPDPLFFVETWTLGMSAAMENFQQRQQRLADGEQQNNVFRPPSSLGPLPSMRKCDFVSYLADATTNEECQNAGWPLQPSEKLASQARVQNPQPNEAFDGQFDNSQEIPLPMTRQSACQLLGVTSNSTRAQIKAAYRHMVGQWHPDRLQHKAAEVRQFATEQMAAINVAYHLLCSK